MSEERTFRKTDRVFQRLFREMTRFRFTTGEDVVTVEAVTAVWFHDGSAIVECRAQECRNDRTPNFQDLFAKSESDPTGEVIRGNMVHSSAIRIGVSAHDHLIECVRAIIPESAERVP